METCKGILAVRGTIIGGDIDIVLGVVSFGIPCEVSILSAADSSER